jgi:hypothetical protein
MEHIMAQADSLDTTIASCDAPRVGGIFSFIPKRSTATAAPTPAAQAEVLPPCPLKASQARMIAAIQALTPYPVGPSAVAISDDYEQRALYVQQCVAAFFAHMTEIAVDLADQSPTMSKKVTRRICEAYGHDFGHELAGYMRAVADEQAVDEGW